LIEAIPINGNNINGNIATTGIGIASETHQVIMSAATASTSFASCETLKGFMKSIKRKRITPASNENRWRRLLMIADIKTEYLLSLTA
jgi:hypothetical protein